MDMAIVVSVVIGLVLGGALVLLVQRSRWRELSGTVEVLRRQGEDARRQAEVAEARIAGHAERLAEATAAREQLGQELNALRERSTLELDALRRDGAAALDELRREHGLALETARRTSAATLEAMEAARFETERKYAALESAATEREQRLREHQQTEQHLGEELAQRTAANQQLAEQIAALREQVGRQEERSAELAKREREVQALQEQLAALNGELVDKAERVATFEAQLHEERRASAEKLGLLQQSHEQLEKQFRGIAAQILEQSREKFETNTTKRLDDLLAPVRDRLKEFQQKVDDTHRKDLEDRVLLRSELEKISAASRRLDQDAVNLTRALKGEPGTQGAWGEVVLDGVLERSGLREGTEYVRQESLLDDEERRQRPDVIVRLPGGRDVVVDSKVSLTDYEAHCSAADADEQTAALGRHIASVRAHIKRLSDKNYWKLAGINTPDFVLMFVPIESALIDAGRHDRALFEDACRCGVILASPNTLVAMLRTIEHSWQVERRNENARAIVRQAGKLYDKLCGFVSDLQDVGYRLGQAQAAYDGALGKLSTGRDNVLRQAERLREMGAKPTKALPAELVGHDPEELGEPAACPEVRIDDSEPGPQRLVAASK